MKTLEALTVGHKHGQTGLIGHNISATDCKYTKQQIAGWSFALHHIIKSRKKADIVAHIAECAPIHLHKLYPNLLLGDSYESIHGYRLARNEYISQKLPKLIEEYKERQKQSQDAA